MRRLVPLLAATTVAVALSGALPGRAAAADECRGLMVCLPVPGPWVAVPPPAADGTSTAVWQIRCPLPGYIVAGVDALVSDRAVDVSIRGENGSPVSPGVTTSRTVLFVAVYTGAARKATAFRPFAGCVPTQGGGGRAQTSVRRPAAFKPGMPVDRRVAERRLVPGAAGRVVVRCPSGSRLVGSQHAFAFRVEEQPGASLLGAVRVQRTEAGRAATARATVAASVPPGLPVVLQLHALCTRVTR